MTAISDERAGDRTLGREHAPTFAERFARPDPAPEPVVAEPSRKRPSRPARVAPKPERPRKSRRARAPKPDPDAFDLASVRMPIDVSSYSLEEIRIALDRADGLESLAAFVKLAWHQIEPEPLIWSWHLDELCTHLEAWIRFEIRNLAVAIPPGLSKSTIAFVLAPVWAWLRDRGRSRWITASNDLSIALRDAQRSKDLLTSRWFRDRWGDLVQLDASVDAKERRGRSDTAGLYYTTAGGRRLATSVGGKGVGWHANYQAVDDANKVLEAESVAAQDTAAEWWDKTMGGRVADPKRLARMVLQQRLAEGDLVGRCLERDEYVGFVLPMEYDPDRHCETPVGGDRRTVRGELLCPSRFDAAAVAEMKVRLGPDGYAAQAQQDPASGGRVAIKTEWFRRWRALPRSGILGDSWDLKRSTALEKARERRQGESWVVGQRWLLQGEDAYLVAEERGLWGFTDTIAAMRRLRSLPAPDGTRLAAVLVENKADGPDAIRVLEAEMQGLIVLVEPAGDKSARARACEPRWQGSHVYVPAVGEWVEQWLREVGRFPRAPNDRVDAMTQALLWGPGSASSSADAFAALGGRR
jgi:predicted phage terminase large subunit-like protein